MALVALSSARPLGAITGTTFGPEPASTTLRLSVLHERRATSSSIRTGSEPIWSAAATETSPEPLFIDSPIPPLSVAARTTEYTKDKTPSRRIFVFIILGLGCFVMLSVIWFCYKKWKRGEPICCGKKKRRDLEKGVQRPRDAPDRGIMLPVVYQPRQIDGQLNCSSRLSRPISPLPLNSSINGLSLPPAWVPRTHTNQFQQKPVPQRSSTEMWPSGYYPSPRPIFQRSYQSEPYPGSVDRGPLPWAEINRDTEVATTLPCYPRTQDPTYTHSVFLRDGAEYYPD